MFNLLLFDIGGGELIVILLFALIAFGSKGIPNVARTLGRAMRQLRDASAEVQREIGKGAEQVKQGFEQQRHDPRAQPPEHAHPTGSVSPKTDPAQAGEPVDPPDQAPQEADAPKER